MKVGDKKQAILLSLVAVGAIAFLFSQLGGTLKGGNPVPRLLAAMAGSPEPARTEASEYPQVVTRDAFSHPKLEMATMKAAAAVASPAKAEEKPAKDAGSAQPPSFASMPTDPSWFKTNSEDPNKPAENTRRADKENEAPGVSIKLLATMRASEWRAMLQVGSGDSIVVSQGQTLAEGIRVTKIGESGVTLRHDGKAFSLTVGGETKL